MDMVSHQVMGIQGKSAELLTVGKTLKIFKSCVCDPPDMGCLDGGDIRPGQVLETDKAGIYVKCGQGCLRIEELQLEGKKRMAAADFLRGCQITEGTVLS